MKKLLVSTFLSLFAFTTASAEVGVNVGVSGQMGLFAASVTETEGTGETHDGSDHLAIGYGSIFVEKDLGDRITIGIDYVPESLDTETAESAKYDKTTTDSFSFICSTTAFSQANNDPPDEEFIQANLDARFIISVMRDLDEIMVRQMENGEDVSTERYKIFHETEGIGIYAMAEMTGFWIEILAVDITKRNRGATKTFQGTFFTNVWLMECR